MGYLICLVIGIVIGLLLFRFGLGPILERRRKLRQWTVYTRSVRLALRGH